MTGVKELNAALGTVENLFRELIRMKAETWRSKKQALDFRNQLSGLLDKLADLYGDIEDWIGEKEE